MSARIMVFNHSKEILMLINEILTDEGYEVFLNTYEPRALEEIERIRPDLVILDCLYRRIDEGWELLQQMRLRRSTASIPVIISTTDPNRMESRTGFLSTKRVALLPKPFDIDDLIAVVKQALTLGEVMPEPSEKSD